MALSGVEGEERACRLLRDLGYLIVARNWRSRFGEIDVIAREGATVVFVEVKTRSGQAYGGPAAAIDARKRERIAATAGLFLQETECELPARFDVVTFVGDAPRLYRDAFRIG